MQLSPDIIEEYFRQYSWSYTRSSENTWITGVRTAVSSFRIFIRMSEHWIYFVINPFVVSPPDPAERMRVYYHILRLNLDMNMAKFGLDGDGDIFLAVELPTENFEYSHFADALNGISHHAERLYSEVFNLAHNPTIVSGRFDDELARIAPHDDDDDIHRNDEDDDDDEPMRPLDDVGLSDEYMSDSQGPIIAGKEVRIVDGEDGSVRIEFQTAHDLEDTDIPATPPEAGDEDDDVPPIPSDLLMGIEDVDGDHDDDDGIDDTANGIALDDDPDDNLDDDDLKPDIQF